MKNRLFKVISIPFLFMSMAVLSAPAIGAPNAPSLDAPLKEKLIFLQKVKRWEKNYPAHLVAVEKEARKSPAEFVRDYLGDPATATAAERIVGRLGETMHDHLILMALTKVRHWAYLEEVERTRPATSYIPYQSAKAAQKILVGMGEEAVSPIIRIIKHSIPKRNFDPLIEVLVKIGEPAVRPLIDQVYFSDPLIPHQEEAYIKALSNMGRPVVKEVRKILDEYQKIEEKRDKIEKQIQEAVDKKHREALKRARAEANLVEASGRGLHLNPEVYAKEKATEAAQHTRDRTSRRLFREFNTTPISEGRLPRAYDGVETRIVLLLREIKDPGAIDELLRLYRIRVQNKTLRKAIREALIHISQRSDESAKVLSDKLKSRIFRWKAGKEMVGEIVTAIETSKRRQDVIRANVQVAEILPSNGKTKKDKEPKRAKNRERPKKQNQGSSSLESELKSLLDGNKVKLLPSSTETFPVVEVPSPEKGYKVYISREDIEKKDYRFACRGIVERLSDQKRFMVQLTLGDSSEDLERIKKHYQQHGRVESSARVTILGVVKDPSKRANLVNLKPVFIQSAPNQEPKAKDASEEGAATDSETDKPSQESEKPPAKKSPKRMARDEGRFQEELPSPIEGRKLYIDRETILGKGTYTVYLGFMENAEKGGGEYVAIKMGEDRDSRHRLKRQYEQQGQIDDPRVVKIRGLVEDTEKPFLVMEYVPGLSLRELLNAKHKEKPIVAHRNHGIIYRTDTISVVNALKLLTEVARAIEPAHNKGILHRDIKPENILITPDGRVKVTDFEAVGSSDSVAEIVSRSLRSMGEAGTVGTLAYMAPEQRVSGRSIDERADVYCFGVLFFEVLTGFIPEGLEELERNLTVMDDHRMNRDFRDQLFQNPSVTSQFRSLIRRLFPLFDEFFKRTYVRKERRLSEMTKVRKELEAIKKELKLARADDSLKSQYLDSEIPEPNLKGLMTAILSQVKKQRPQHNDNPLTHSMEDLKPKKRAQEPKKEEQAKDTARPTMDEQLARRKQKQAEAREADDRVIELEIALSEISDRDALKTKRDIIKDVTNLNVKRNKKRSSAVVRSIHFIGSSEKDPGKNPFIKQHKDAGAFTRLARSQATGRYEMDLFFRNASSSESATLIWFDGQWYDMTPRVSASASVVAVSEEIRHAHQLSKHPRKRLTNKHQEHEMLERTVKDAATDLLRGLDPALLGGKGKGSGAYKVFKDVGDALKKSAAETGEAPSKEKKGKRRKGKGRRGK